MELSHTEFLAMNSGLRAFLHRHLEFPLCRRLGLRQATGRDVVEIGCGNGLGAELISGLAPRSYVGLDIMPEQIALAAQRNVPHARFMVGDATDISSLSDATADMVVVFGILHHIDGWPRAIAEIRRLLRPGGLFLIEEPDSGLLRLWDRFFQWGHPQNAFSLHALERELQTDGLILERRLKIPGVFGMYRARLGYGA